MARFVQAGSFFINVDACQFINIHKQGDLYVIGYHLGPYLLLSEPMHRAEQAMKEVEEIVGSKGTTVKTTIPIREVVTALAEEP